MSLFQKRLSLTQNYQNHTDTSGCCSFSSTHTQLTLTHFMHVSLSQVRSSLSQNAPFIDSKTDVIDSKTLPYFIGSKAVIICTQKWFTFLQMQIVIDPKIVLFFFIDSNTVYIASNACFIVSKTVTIDSKTMPKYRGIFLIH